MTMPSDNAGKVGRPNVDVPTDRVIEMRDAGQSWRAIARTLDRAPTTIRRAYNVAKCGRDPYQNSGTGEEENESHAKTSLRSETTGVIPKIEP